MEKLRVLVVNTICLTHTEEAMALLIERLVLIFSWHRLEGNLVETDISRRIINRDGF